MSRRDFTRELSDAEWRARLDVLKQAPEPELLRGRARVLAAVQARQRSAFKPRRAMFALSFGAGFAVFMAMVVLSSAMGTMNGSFAGYTRTDTALVQANSPESVPANALVKATPERGYVTLAAPRTPIPGAVPEPPRSPWSATTLTIEP